MAARFIPQASFYFPMASLRTNNTDIHHKQVTDTRPPGMRPNYSDASSVAKYELPPAEYEKRGDSVLAWKKANKLGRFDPVCIPRPTYLLSCRDHEFREYFYSDRAVTL
jgi:hypothetical protein